MDERMPDLTPMSIPELYQGLDMGVGALGVHESLHDVIMNGASIEEIHAIVDAEMERIAAGLTTIALEIQLKASSS